jgi:hypothetical protein
VAVQAPAICGDCSAIFPSGIAFEEDAKAHLADVASVCPVCGGTASVPDGFYEFIGGTLTIVSTWSPERIARVAEDLEVARRSRDRQAAEAVVRENEDLLDIAKRLLIPRTAGQFWAFIAALLAALQLLQASETNPNITVNERTIVQQICKPAPKPQKPRPTKERRDIPRQPRKPRR